MRLTIPTKLAILICVSGALTMAAIGLQLVYLKDRIWEDRQQMLVSQVQSALAIVTGFAAQAERGEISEAEAKRLAASAVRSIRYGNGDYFFVLSNDGTMVVHPKPQREGASAWNDTDANGFHQSRALIQQAQAGGGFTSYVWPRLGEDVPSPKLAYSEPYKPWNWAIATGVYVDDIDAQFAKDAYTSLAWLAAILVVLGACAWPIARSISKPLARTTATMRELAAGHNDVEVSYVDRQDEIGEIARAVESFKLAAIEKQRLEAAAEEAREREEAARNRQIQEEHAKTEELEAFVGEIRQGFDRLSEGDLTVRLDRPVAPQYETIRSQFNDSVSSLEETIGSVVGSIASLRSGLSEIATASNNLSQRTEQQAASLEETVAALGQVTGAVNETATGAGEAREAASAAKNNAAKGGEIVDRAITAMNGIESSSKQISQIIGVIDEIAFQTNLLALNAGVEAARAGDAGKGFAVVAQEVRALAQRSADAAKEIKELISRSNGQVQTGVELVTASGASLQEIVAQVGRMNDLVSEIAAKAKDQAVSLNEVSVAADEMDKVTQQNAAMVEESTAASETLARETSELAERVARFRIGGAAAPAAAAKPAAKPVAQLRPVTRGNLAVVASSEAAEDSWEEF